MGYFDGTRAQSRDYQERLCAKAETMLDGTWTARDGNRPVAARSVLIESPTGSGKTVVALALAQAAARRGKRIGWVAMRRNLLKQAAGMRDSLGFDVPNIRMISMFDQDPPRDVDWLFVDEAQHDSTDSMARIHGVIKPEKVIGLSATPYRTDRARLSFDRTIRDVGIHTLIAEGWLSQFDHFTVPKYGPAEVAGLFRAFPDRWGKSVAFFLTLDDCRAASAALTEAGVTNDIVWAGSDRDAQIDAFRAGGLQVLVSMSILSEGFDADDLQTVFVRPSSKLPGVQMCGRVLRLHEGTPVKQVVQCQSTHHPFVRTAPARTSYMLMDGEFRSLARNERIDAIARQTADLVLQARVVLPNALMVKRGRGRRRRFGRDNPGDGTP